MSAKSEKYSRPVIQINGTSYCEESDELLQNKIKDAAIAKRIITPPDGGWGWIIVAASFLTNLTIDGILFSFGIILPYMAHTYDASHFEISIAGSLMSGIFLMIGPLASIVANSYGLRSTAIIGSAMATFGIAISYYAPNVATLCTTYGVIGGIGFGFLYMPSVISVGIYFERWRALATGIAMCGSGIGALIFAPLISFLSEHFHWQVVLLCQAGAVVLCMLYGSTYRPLTPKTIDEEHEVLSNALQIPEAIPGEHNTSVKLFDKHQVPKYKSSSNLFDRRLSTPNFSSNVHQKHSFKSISNGDLTNKYKKKSSLPETSFMESNTELYRPLSQRDIFYSGSIVRLNRKSLASNTLSHQSCKTAILGISSWNVFFLFQRHWEILTSPSFILYSLSGFMTMVGVFIPFIFSVERARKNGMDSDTAVWLVSSIGIANTIGKVLCGLLSSLTGIDALLINIVAIAVGGITLILSGLSMSIPFQFTYTVIFGLCIACFAALKSVILVELLGLDNLTNAFGMFTVFMGIGSVLGPPTAASLIAVTKSFDAGFYMAGCLFLLSSILLIVLRYVNKWEKEKMAYEEKI